jgi:carbon starvation protein
VCVASVIIGFAYPVSMSGDTWRWLMTAYVFVACSLPVWFVLQPRDFTNVQILYGGMLLLLLSVIVAGANGATLQAPGFDLAAGEAALRGPVWPLLFITVACGAISGFHSLVASGTTVKQIPRESDCRRIGYGAMAVESFLAVLVLMAVASMLPHAEYFAVVYPDGRRVEPDPRLRARRGPSGPHGLSAGAHRRGRRAGHPDGGGVRHHDARQRRRLCRYLLEEFWQFAFAGGAPAILRRPVVNTGIAVALMLGFALSGTIRQMWPVFGAGNQLLGALALVTVSVWLAQRARRHLFALLPATFMIVDDASRRSASSPATT